jgi:hypothetical protein
MKQVKPNSVDEALAAWDAGDEVETVEMGALGAGYEMAIQCVAFELMRALRDDPALAKINAETADNETFPPEFDELLDHHLYALEERQPMGLSGAQAGAGKSIAVNFTRHGWQNARDTVPDRMIFTRKQDPMALYAAEKVS